MARTHTARPAADWMGHVPRAQDGSQGLIIGTSAGQQRHGPMAGNSGEGVMVTPEMGNASLPIDLVGMARQHDPEGNT